MPADSTAAELLHRVRERYARARSYRDTGERTTICSDWPEPEDRRVYRVAFDTTFLRPDLLRFQVCAGTPIDGSPPKLAVVWQDEAGVHPWSATGSSTPAPRDLASALAALRHARGGAAAFAAQLLGLLGAQQTLLDPESARVTGRQLLAGRDCARIDGHRRNGEPLRVWVDVTSDALVRTEEHVEFDAASQASCMHRLEREIPEMEASDPRRPLWELVLGEFYGKREFEFQAVTVTVWHPEFDVDLDVAAVRYTPPG